MHTYISKRRRLCHSHYFLTELLRSTAGGFKVKHCWLHLLVYILYFIIFFISASNVICYFLHSSGASNQTDCFSHLGGVGACWSGSGDWSYVSFRPLFHQTHQIFWSRFLSCSLVHYEIKAIALWSLRLSKKVMAPRKKCTLCKLCFFCCCVF